MAAWENQLPARVQGLPAGRRHACAGWPAALHPYLGLSVVERPRCDPRRYRRPRHLAAEGRAGLAGRDALDDLPAHRGLAAAVEPAWEPFLSLAHLTVLDLPPPAVIRVAAEAGCRAAGAAAAAGGAGCGGVSAAGRPGAAAGDAGGDGGDRGRGRRPRDRHAAAGTPASPILPALLRGRREARRAACAGRRLRSGRGAADRELRRLLRGGGGFRPDRRPGIHALDQYAGPGRRDPRGARRGPAEWRHPGGCAASRPLAEPGGGYRHGARRMAAHTGSSATRRPERPTTTEGLLHTARAERLFPGEGGLDLAPLVRAMPAGIPVSLEIPTLALAKTMGPEARVRRAAMAARRVIAAARARHDRHAGRPRHATRSRRHRHRWRARHRPRHRPAAGRRGRPRGDLGPRPGRPSTTASRRRW